MNVPSKKDDTPIDDYFEKKDYYNVVEVIEDNVVIEETPPVVVNQQPKRLTYTNRNSGSLRINRF